MTITVCPVQYNPVTGVIRTYHNIDIQVEPASGPGVNEKTKSFPHPSKLFMPMYRQLENFEFLGLDQDELQPPGTLMIVCANNATALQYANQIADWKMQKGIPTNITTIEYGYSYGQTLALVQNVYNTSEPPLEFLLLIGDAGTPSESYPFRVPTYPTPGYGNDHSYSRLDGTDILADIAVGRLSTTNNATEMTLMVDKTINYEKDPYMTNPQWFTNGYTVAGTYYDGAYINSNIYTMKYVQQRMEEEGLDVTYSQYNSEHINASEMRNEINEGKSFFFCRPGGIGQMVPSDLTGISNGPMTPFVLVITCATGNFASEDACLSEAWLRGTSINAGRAIGAVGTTSLTSTRFDNMIASGVAHGFFVEHVPEQGLALNVAKFELYRNYNATESGAVVSYSEKSNLMGDPSVKIWTAVPQLFNVGHPASIPLGRDNVPILVKDAQGNPVADALVCLMKGTETWTRALTDESGYLHMPTNPRTVGIDLLTVSKTGFKPYQADISVGTQPLYLGYEQTVLIDDDNVGGTSGNGDRVINPGETVDLQIQIHNYGNQTTATLTRALLWSYNQTIATVLVAGQSYRNPIAPGQSVPFTGSFRVQISKYAQDQVLTPLLLRIYCQQNALGDTSLIPLPIISGRAQFESIDFPGGNNYPWDGTPLIVYIKNVGSRDYLGTQGQLITSDPRIKIIDGSSSFGDIGVDQEANNNADPFILDLGEEEPFTGHPVTFILALSGNAQPQFHDTVTFVAEVGEPTLQDPTEPDTYGYYCYDNTEEEPRYDVKVRYGQYDWVEISDPENELTNLVDLEEGEDCSVTISLPFDFRMYGVDYETDESITICSNGWAAMGNQIQFADFRNYRIPGPIGPNAMLAALWDDLVVGGPSYGHAYWEYREAQNILIIEWNGVQTRVGGYPETFEIILYDPSVYHTRTGDGIIKFQYQVVNNVLGGDDDNPYATVGIEDNTQTDGIEVTYHETIPNGYAPGAAHLQDGRSYLFTNLENLDCSEIEGSVTNSVTQEPIEGATVAIPQAFYETQTNEQGLYIIQEVLTGQYDVTCSAPGYWGYVEHDVEIVENFVRILNFQLPPTDGGFDSERRTGFLKPYEYSLGQSYPNPFNPVTTIPYCLKEPGAVKLAVYNVLGQKVATLVDEFQEAGPHQASLDASLLAAGIYFYRMEAGSFTDLHKMVLLK